MTFPARLGVFARTFVRDRPAEVSAAVAQAGYSLAHWNFAAIGLPTLGDGVAEDVFADVRTAFEADGLRIPSVSGSFNAIEPDPEWRAEQVHQAVRLIGQAPLLGAEIVTLCTGTRNTQNMWRSHPENTSASAWRDLRVTLDALLVAADEAGVVLGVEPEAGNVVNDAYVAARLLSELGVDAPVGIVFDPANLLSPGTLHRQIDILTEAADLLGPQVVAVHAKDVVDSGYSAAGAGGMDYGLVLRLLDRIPPVPVIVQDVSEVDAVRVRGDLLAWHRVVRS
ncbi:sugar phosphate isomerase/epimerase [Lentzea alba]|uniref:sugar phosphate isomerase/epimerase family protein n=1 Tax=Lentzea alba TaxID=2714351 RepID=UPI0039BF5634